MQRCDEEWCFSLLFSPPSPPNGMQIAICLSQQLWMCTTKQGAFEPTVTLLIMCWRNTGRGDRVSAERGRKKKKQTQCFHCPSCRYISWLECKSVIGCQVQLFIKQLHTKRMQATSVLTFTQIWERTRVCCFFSQRRLNVIILLWHHL